MEDRFNNDHLLKNKGASNASNTVDMARHRWYYYKEGFSPELVKTAIASRNLDRDAIVIDPFNGSGTVTLTSALEGVKSVGFEVNPFTNFLARTKTLSANNKVFRDEMNRLFKSCSKNNVKPSYLEGFSTFTESQGHEKWLFNIEVIRAFNSGYQIHKNNKSEISSLLKLALISAAMDNCNAKKDGKCLRYKPNWEGHSHTKDTFLNSLESICNKISQDLDSNIEVDTRVINGDSRLLLESMNEKFQLCITSPPYLNTFDYTDIYRPELFLGEFVTTPQELYNLRLRTVRSHIQANWDKPDLSVDYGSLFSDVYEKIKGRPNQLMHKNIPSMIMAYFEDMKRILALLSLKADKGAGLWMVVSTSAYANEHIPVDLILADIGTKTGWNLKEIGVLREITKRRTKHSPDIDKLRESVIIFEK